VTGDHGLIEGIRYPAYLFEHEKSVYEVVCKCRKAFSAFSWDLALDAYLDHHDEVSMMESEALRVAAFVNRVAEASA
jgi:hypothetical protein